MYFFHNLEHLNTDLQSKQPASTAITTQNIGQQHVKSADSAVDQTARNSANAALGKFGGGVKAGGTTNIHLDLNSCYLVTATQTASNPPAVAMAINYSGTAILVVLATSPGIFFDRSANIIAVRSEGACVYSVTKLN